MRSTHAGTIATIACLQLLTGDCLAILCRTTAARNASSGPMISPDQKTRLITPITTIATRTLKDHSLADKNTAARPSRRDATRNIMVTSTTDENGADLSAMAVCTAMVAVVPNKVRPEIEASHS